MKPRITRSIVPNLLTLANLFAGFLSIVYSSQGNYSSAAIFIFAAAVFDMLDGFMARLINAASEFGVELDSLCDAVSFGIAPSFLLYQIYFHELGELGIADFVYVHKKTIHIYFMGRLFMGHGHFVVGHSPLFKYTARNPYHSFRGFPWGFFGCWKFYRL